MKTKPTVPRMRRIVKARLVAGCVVVSLPVELRDALQIKAGDRVCIEVAGAALVVTKE